MRALCVLEYRLSKKIAVISKSELSKLHVGTLMSRRDALLKCEEAFELSDQFGHTEPLQDGSIEFKNTIQWKQAYEELKMELSKRENVPSKFERKLIRKEKAKQCK